MTGRLREGSDSAPITQVAAGRKATGRDLLGYLAGVLAVLVCTFSLTGQFVLDDRLVLVDHPIFRDKLPIWQLFVLDQWGQPLSGQVTTYRPIMPLFWWPFWHFFPNNPFVFRLLTLFLHLAATLTVIKLGRIYVKDRLIVGFAAVLFAVLAVHSEAIGSIAHQNEILSFLFCTWALYFIDRKKAGLVPLLFLILAVLIKESAIIFYPAIILLFLARREIGHRIFTVAAILIIAGIMIWVQLSLDRAPFLIGNMDNLSYDAHGGERLLHGLYSIGRSFSLMLIPQGLAPFHGYAGMDLSTQTLLPFAMLGGSVLLAGSVVLLWGLRQRQPALVLGISILIGPLLLQSNLFIRTFAELSERWLYTPSLAVCFILSTILVNFHRRLKEKRLDWLGIICLAAIIVMHLFISWKVLPAWRKNDALMAFAVQQEPAAYQSRYFHAKYLLQKDQTYEGLWYATTSAMIKKEYFRTSGRSGKKKFSVLSGLDKMPVKQRFRMAPAAIEPQRACGYVIDSIVETAKLQPTPPPEILNMLAGLYASQGYGGCFTNQQQPSPSVPFQRDPGD